MPNVVVKLWPGKSQQQKERYLSIRPFANVHPLGFPTLRPRNAPGSGGPFLPKRSTVTAPANHNPVSASTGHYGTVVAPRPR